jgi:thiol-disulfide isomerase/thioredoxin
LDSRRSSADAPEFEKRLIQSLRHEWIRVLAQIAEAENRVADALELHRSTLQGVPREILAQAKNPMIAAVRKLYLAHGGAEENWVEWATAGKAVPEAPRRPPLAFSQSLPDFSANDLSGRIWRRRDLEGKGTLVNYWATWCGPCRAEHPDLQKLHERLNDRKDVQVLTVSVDDTPALAAAYVKEKGYTFPVIHAPALADKLLPWAGLPANFLVNGKGERTTFYPFLSGEAGLRQAVADLEEAAQQRD